MVRIKVGALIRAKNSSVPFLTRSASKRKLERICANGKVLPSVAGFLHHVRSRIVTTIPTSGAFLRAFAGASMTAGTRHVATVIASAISYDGKYRGAPRGHAAFTMNEIEAITGLAARTIRAALTELSEMFGLVIIRRHHQRHFFRFTRIATSRNETVRRPSPDASNAVDEPASSAGVTGSEMPVTPYREEKKNNNCSVKVKIKDGESVYRTPWASIIDRFKRGTPAEKVDTQFLWNGFCGLNRRNGHETVPLRFLIGFLSKYPGRKQAFTAKSSPEPAAAAPIRLVEPGARRVIEMASPAPFQNRHFHKSDLQRRIGEDGYEARVSAIMDRFDASRFSAELAVHGEAVRCGEIHG